MIKSRKIKLRKRRLRHRTKQNRSNSPVLSMRFVSSYETNKPNLISNLLRLIEELSEISKTIESWKSFKSEREKKNKDILCIFNQFGATLRNEIVSPIGDNINEAIAFLKEQELDHDIRNISWNCINHIDWFKGYKVYSSLPNANSYLNQLISHIPTAAETTHGAKLSTILCTYQI